MDNPSKNKIFEIHPDHKQTQTLMRIFLIFLVLVFFGNKIWPKYIVLTVIVNWLGALFVQTEAATRGIGKKALGAAAAGAIGWKLRKHHDKKKAQKGK